jgi:curli biogenesis system outer membrane secretion channel CsgG
MAPQGRSGGVLLAALLLLTPVAAPIPARAQSSSGRPTVAVPEFKNTVTPQTWWWQGPVATDLAAALANELQSTGTLQVVERRNLNAVLSEQELTELGIVRKAPGAATKGRMTGARYLVLGTITAYDSNVEEKTTGSTFGLLGFGKSQQALETKDYVAIDIRVVDSTTGEVVGARTVEGRASNVANANRQGVNLLPAAGAALLLFPNMGRTGQVLTGAAGTLNFGNNNAQSQRTPPAKAIRAALVDAADYISCVLTPRGNCMAKLEAQDQLRRERTRSVLQPD